MALSKRIEALKDRLLGKKPTSNLREPLIPQPDGSKQTKPLKPTSTGIERLIGMVNPSLAQELAGHRLGKGGLTTQKIDKAVELLNGEQQRKRKKHRNTP